MLTLTPEGPWALRLVTDRLPVGPPPYATVTLDPVTQTACYTVAGGRPVEMGTAARAGDLQPVRP
ncbi:putative ATP-grasp-modified RiPP [Streptomyces sp. NPDC019990]|uniref:putative ATP-grasp-modified RiPP n=1 Tax=Streptomyces sp. NPDC019990 TaxID=3154693 RepID=UPI0033FCC8A1